MYGDEKYDGKAVVFDGVSFAYANGRNVLEDISFSLEHGKTLGIIGATGSGKSTVVNLILGLYEPTKGKVYIDGKSKGAYDERRMRMAEKSSVENSACFTELRFSRPTR